MTVRISDADRQLYLGRALEGADWFVRTQLGQWRPRTHLGDDRLVDDNRYFQAGQFEGERDPAKDWTTDRGIAFDTNRGRFLYYWFRPGRKYVPGLNWTMGRALFVLTEAFKLTGQYKYREAAHFGAKYIQALQVTDPYYAKTLGTIRELTPQGSGAGTLDGAQAASGLLMLERVTGEANWLRLGRMFGDFILRHFTPEEGLPVTAFLRPEEEVRRQVPDRCIQYCTTIPLWHLYKRTGEKSYLAPVIWAADRTLEFQRGDGALLSVRSTAGRTGFAGPSSSGPPLPNHHDGHGEGDERFVLRNDDAAAVVVLAAHEATGDPKYLDAAVAYADWIVSQTPMERPFCAFPVQANTVLDVGKAAGKDYSNWVLEHLKRRLLDLQVLDEEDAMAHGGFRGEDEQGDGGVFGGTSLDYVVTRVTCYSIGTLFRLSGKGTGAGFSVWGL